MSHNDFQGILHIITLTTFIFSLMRKISDFSIFQVQIHPIQFVYGYGQIKHQVNQNI